MSSYRGELSTEIRADRRVVAWQAAPLFEPWPKVAQAAAPRVGLAALVATIVFHLGGPLELRVVTWTLTFVFTIVVQALQSKTFARWQQRRVDRKANRWMAKVE